MPGTGRAGVRAAVELQEGQTLKRKIKAWQQPDTRALCSREPHVRVWGVGTRAACLPHDVGPAQPAGGGEGGTDAENSVESKCRNDASLQDAGCLGHGLRWFGSVGRVLLGVWFSVWLAPRPTGEGTRLFPLEWEGRPHWGVTAAALGRGRVSRAIACLRLSAAPGGWGDTLT